MSLWGDACRFCQQARWFILLVLTVVFVFWGIWGWKEIASWYKDSAPVVAFGTGEAAQPSAHPGELIIFYLPFKKMRDCPGTIQRVITGDCGHIVVHEQHSTVKSGIEGRMTIAVQVPHEAIPGQCGFQVHARYICNPFDYVMQRQVFVSPIIPFTVKSYDE